MKSFYFDAKGNRMIADKFVSILKEFGYKLAIQSDAMCAPIVALDNGDAFAVSRNFTKDCNERPTFYRIDDLLIYLKSISRETVKTLDDLVGRRGAFSEYLLAKNAVLKLAHEPEKGLSKEEANALFKVNGSLQDLLFFSSV